MKNLFFKQSASMILLMLMVLAMCFFALVFGADNGTAIFAPATPVALMVLVFALALVATAVFVTSGKNKEFSFWKTFLPMITFPVFVGFGLYFIFTSKFLLGFVLVGIGIVFLIALNILDVVVQSRRGKSILAK